MFRFHIITNIGTLLVSRIAQDAPATLCLSQLCDESPSYTHALKAKLAKGHRVILDNGAHEGFDVDIEEYYRTALDLQPTVVILTDLVGRPYLDSRAQSLRFVDRVDQDGKLRSKFMYAAQGQSRDEVLTDYEWALANLDPERFVIGFGQGYLQWVEKPGDENLEATRVPMVEAVMTMKHADKHEFHVLGARWSADGSNYARFPQISGIDTIKPVTCAKHSSGLYPSRPAVRSIDRTSYDVVNEGVLRMNIMAFCAEYGCESGLKGE